MDVIRRITDRIGGSRVLILGFGREGRSTYRLLRGLFPERRIGVADRRPDPAGLEDVREDPFCTLHLGPSYLESVRHYDLVIRSPGIPPTQSGLAEYARRITSQTELFLEACGERVIGVTGTKGKSTCASLVHAVLSSRFPDTLLLGNIGVPALDGLHRIRAHSFIVCELSSHQLAGVERSPHIAVFLNLFPEHMDYYGSWERYVEAKSNIARHSGADDVLIYHAGFPELCALAGRTPARCVPFDMEKKGDAVCWCEGERIFLREEGKVRPVLSCSEIPLPGRFNVNNVIPAVIVARMLQVPVSLIRAAVQRFSPLRHRLQYVGTYGGIAFYDDSISTIPECTLAALEYLGDRTDTLILGGYDRGQDFRPLVRALLKRRTRTLVLLPETGGRIYAVYREERGKGAPLLRVVHARDMEDAVRAAFENTRPGKACLLSPASPSYGMFRDFRERGELFQHWIRTVARERGFPPPPLRKGGTVFP